MKIMLRLIQFILIYAFAFTVNAQPVVLINAKKSNNYIGGETQLLEDASQRLGIKQILNKNIKFENSSNDVPNLNVSNSNYWLRFVVSNQSQYNDLMLTIENPLIDYAVLYLVNGNHIDSLDISSATWNRSRLINHQFFSFPIKLDTQDSVVCYLKVHSKKQLLVPIRIMSVQSTFDNLLNYDLRSALFAGIMLAMFVYNLFLYVTARDKHYLYYVHYIFWVGIAQLSVLGYFQRFFESSDFTVTYLIPFVGAMSGIASVLFVQSFLNVKKYNKLLNYLLYAIIIGDLIAIAILFVFVDPLLSYKVVNVVAIVGSLIVLYVAYTIYKRGNQSAKLFLIAWGVFLTSVIIFVLKDLGVLPYNAWTVSAVQIGASVEAMLLSFALGNKINIYRREKENFQQREVAALLENERLVREQNQLLEKKINERTEELLLTNESLEHTLINLKEAQSQLVQSEKMASLGQLTAGVAHEINNPINFVTSNVSPLKRDIAMLWDAFDEMERIAMDESLSLDNKEKAIIRCKQSLDIDYLKIEIDFLLKGIYEGASRTAEIVKSLRNFSRVDEDTLKSTDIHEGLDSTLLIVKTLLNDSIEVNKNYGDIPLLFCYPGKLNQVFLNIFTNGIYAINKKFGSTAGGKITISTCLSEDKESVLIEISDNGIGIPNHILSRIFEPFFTTKDVGEGTGLGMSIVFTTIEKHNGNILVNSQEGEFTKFSIILPINRKSTSG